MTCTRNRKCLFLTIMVISSTCVVSLRISLPRSSYPAVINLRSAVTIIRWAVTIIRWAGVRLVLCCSQNRRGNCAGKHASREQIAKKATTLSTEEAIQNGRARIHMPQRVRRCISLLSLHFHVVQFHSASERHALAFAPSGV